MKTLRVATLLFTAIFACASSASALQITLDSYSVSANTSSSGGGLRVEVDDIVPFGGNFTTNDLAVGQSQTFSLFELSSDESDNQVNGNDDDPRPISVTFSFSSPAGAGSVSGQTIGGELDDDPPGPNNSVDYDFGSVTWGSPLVVSFTGGQFRISLADAMFWCEGDCSPGPGEFNGANIQATIELLSLNTNPPVGGSAPEPASIVLLGTGLAFAARRLRRQKR